MTALLPSDVTKIGIGVIVGLVVLGLLFSLLVTAIIGRLIVAVAVIALAAYVWQQRTSIADSVNTHKCDLSASFFGMHVDAPADVKRYCRAHT